MDDRQQWPFIWRCGACETVFDSAAKKKHKYGEFDITTNVCPVCGSSRISCISLPWRFDYDATDISDDNLIEKEYDEE